MTTSSTKEKLVNVGYEGDNAYQNTAGVISLRAESSQATTNDISKRK